MAVEFIFKKARLDFFRSCVRCGHGIHFLQNKSGHKNQILCTACKIKLQNYCMNGWTPGYDSNVLSLYSWHSDIDGLARSLVMGLKGGGQCARFEALARELCALRLARAQRLFGKTLFFIPAPARKGTKQLDHAGLLAKSLADICGGVFFPCLERVKETQQKKKNRNERYLEGQTLKISMSSEAQASALLEPNKQVVFVDDIITTGQTAKSAYNALGKPDNFEIWTIFHRPRLM